MFCYVYTENKPFVGYYDNPLMFLCPCQALSWCPWQLNLLATGGGSSDKTVKFWNVTSGQCMKTLTTDSQVSKDNTCTSCNTTLSPIPLVCCDFFSSSHPTGVRSVVEWGSSWGVGSSRLSPEPVGPPPVPLPAVCGRVEGTRRKDTAHFPLPRWDYSGLSWNWWDTEAVESSSVTF